MYLQLTGTNVRLLGSMHLFPADRPDLPDWVASAYEWAESLVFESDALGILPFLRVPQGSPRSPSAKEALPMRTWERLHAAWPSAGPLAPLAELHPWAALIVAPTLYQRATGGVEPHLLAAAMKQGRLHRFLETAADIVASLESIPLASVEAALDLLLADLTEPQRTLEQMHAAWLRRDLRAVYAVAAASPMFGLPGIRDAILDARNRAWAPHVSALMDNPQRTLVVVGALHLCGADNLIERLGASVEDVLG